MEIRNILTVLTFCCVASTAGCMKTRLTDPKRTASEQLLLSTAADRALAEAETQVSVLAGRTVYINTSYLESYDQYYVNGAIRDLLSRAGALLMNDIKDADIVVEPRSGALSIDSGSALGGIPSIPIPIPTVATLETPEVAFFKSENQASVGKFALLAYERESRQHVFSTPALVGTAYRNHYQLLGVVKFLRTDIPEYKWKRERSEAE